MQRRRRLHTKKISRKLLAARRRGPTEHPERLACTLDNLYERFAHSQPLVQLPCPLLALANSLRLAVSLSCAGVNFKQAPDDLSTENVDQRAEALHGVEVEERVLLLDGLDEDVKDGREERRIGREEGGVAVEHKRAKEV